MAEKLDSSTRREQIARAALDVVAEHGVGGMTVDRIARQVGVVPSALYRHFPNKAAIIDAVLDHVRDRMLGNAAWARATGTNPVEALRLLLWRQVEMIRELPSVPRILFSDEVLSRDEEGRTRFLPVSSDFLAAVAALVAEGQKQGMVRPDVEPERCGLLFVGLYAPLALFFHTSGGRLDVAAQLETNWRVFHRGIAADPRAVDAPAAP